MFTSARTRLWRSMQWVASWELVVAARTAGHAKAVRWARERFGTELLWGIEDCRHLSAHLRA